MSNPPGDIPPGPHQDLISLLAELRARRHRPSFEAIAARIPSKRGRKTSKGNLQQVFSGQKIPSGNMAMAIVRALDGTAAEEARALRYAEDAAAQRPGRRPASASGPAFDLTQLSLPALGGLGINQVAPVPGVSAERLMVEALSSFSIDPPLEHLPPLLHGRRLITSEIVDHLNALDDELSQELTLWVLHGMGGAGKSAIALSIAEYCATADIDVFWISASDTTQLTAGMRELSVRKAQSGSPIRSGSIADAAWQVLNRAERPWLLVFDAADDPAVFKPGGSQQARRRRVDPAEQQGTCSRYEPAGKRGDLGGPRAPAQGRNTVCQVRGTDRDRPIR